MEKFLKPEFKKIIKNETKNPNLGIFILEKLSRGFAQTIGTSLRRTILSSIPGASIFAIEIVGVQHEFQPISNVKEDVVELILNLKELIIEAEEDKIDIDEIYEFKFKSTKTNEALASEIKVPEGFKIVNGDLVIANLFKSNALEFTLHVQYSRGYRTFEENKEFVKEKLGSRIGLIAIDSIYSNVKNVNYKIEKVNPGEAKVFERLILEIETRGSVLPEKIISQAASILSNYYKSFNDLYEVNLDEQFIKEVEEEQDDSNLLMPIDSLNLSARSENALKLAGIKTVEELIDRPVSALQDIKNLGEKSKIEIIQIIQELGFSFKSE